MHLFFGGNGGCLCFFILFLISFYPSLAAPPLGAFFISFLFIWMQNKVIGWRRTYTDPTVPVTNVPLTSRDSLFHNRDPLQKVTLFLEKLYSIPEMRGYDLYDLAYVKKGHHANVLLDQGKPVSFVYPPWKDPEDSPARWYQRNQHTIDDLLQRYPRLFVFQKAKHIVGGSCKKQPRSLKCFWKRQFSRNRNRNRNRNRKTKCGRKKSLASKTNKRTQWIIATKLKGK